MIRFMIWIIIKFMSSIYLLKKKSKKPKKPKNRRKGKQPQRVPSEISVSTEIINNNNVKNNLPPSTGVTVTTPSNETYTYTLQNLPDMLMLTTDNVEYNRGMKIPQSSNNANTYNNNNNNNNNGNFNNNNSYYEYHSYSPIHSLI